MSLEDRGVIAIWEGEWPWLRRGVRTAREWSCLIGAPVVSVLDFAGYLASAKLLTAQADRFMMEQTALASSQLRERRWILPATGITATSVFVIVKSAPWGTYRAMRNGAATAFLLTAFLFPREIIARVDEALPFGTQDASKN